MLVSLNIFKINVQRRRVGRTWSWDEWSEWKIALPTDDISLATKVARRIMSKRYIDPPDDQHDYRISSILLTDFTYVDTSYTAPEATFD